jgi:hypothetical protein
VRGTCSSEGTDASHGHSVAGWPALEQRRHLCSHLHSAAVYLQLPVLYDLHTVDALEEDEEEEDEEEEEEEEEDGCLSDLTAAGLLLLLLLPLARPSVRLLWTELLLLLPLLLLLLAPPPLPVRPERCPDDELVPALRAGISTPLVREARIMARRRVLSGTAGSRPSSRQLLRCPSRYVTTSSKLLPYSSK